MKFNLARFVFLWVIIINPLDAAVFHTLDTTELLRCVLSSTHHNRIAIRDGRILKVIFQEEDIAIRLEEESGQIFVQTLTQEPRKSTISIVSDSGQVQDLLLNFHPMPSQILILQDQGSLGHSSSEKTFISHQERGESHHMIADVKIIQEGGIPSGYLSCPVEKEIVRIRRGVFAEKIGHLVGCKDQLHLWRIENRSWTSRSLCEQELNFGQASWIHLGSRKLGSGQNTIAIIASELS